MVTNLDDTDPRISYSGSWQAYSGGSQSTRQWNSSIHSTNQNGASATITFIGSSVKVYCTTPSGSGTESIAIITLDGQKVATVTRTTTSNPVYYDTWYYSGNLANVEHTIVITNGGSSSDSPLQLDALDIDGDVIQAQVSTPVTTTPASSPQTRSNTPSLPSSTPQPSAGQSSTPSSGNSSSIASSSTTRSSPSDSIRSSSNIITSAGSSSSSSNSVSPRATLTSSGSGSKSSSDQKITTIFSVSTAADGTVSTQIIESPVQSSNQLSGSSTSHVGAIAGAVIGAIVLVVVVVLLLCLRRRHQRQGRFLKLGKSTPGTIKPTDVTPFNLEENNTGRVGEPSPITTGESSRYEKAAIAAAAAAENPSSPSDEVVDLALRRWIERHPEILLNRTAVISNDPGTSSTVDGHSQAEDFELGTFSSMYASTVAGTSSTESPPPAYRRSSKHDSRWSTNPNPASPLSPSSPIQKTQL